MPSGPLQIFPPGLLGFFQIKNDGRNPNVLLEALQPTLDLTEWYLWAAFERHTGTGALSTGQLGPRIIESAAVAAGVGLKSPPDEWWYVHGFTIMCNAATAVTASDLVYIQPMMNIGGVGGGAAHIWILPSNKLSSIAETSAAEDFAYAVGTAKPFFMPPSSELMMWVVQADTTASGALITRGDATITRLPA